MPSQKQAPNTQDPPSKTLRFYSHSLLFYYWPMWLMSLVLGVLSTIDPSHTNVYGSIFLLGLLFSLLSISVDIRGLWVVLFGLASIIILMLLNMVGILDDMLVALFKLNIAINPNFYFAFGLPIMFAWLFVTFIYDRRRFVELRAHELTVVKEIGEGVISFDTTGMVFRKQRDNFMQHMVFGMGSGDLIITAGISGHKETIHIDNVLSITKKIKHMHAILEQRHPH